MICRPDLNDPETRKKAKKYVLVEFEISISDNS